MKLFFVTLTSLISLLTQLARTLPFLVFFVAEITRAGTNGDGVPDNVDNCISVDNPGEEYFAATASS